MKYVQASQGSLLFLFQSFTPPHYLSHTRAHTHTCTHAAFCYRSFKIVADLKMCIDTNTQYHTCLQRLTTSALICHCRITRITSELHIATGTHKVPQMQMSVLGCTPKSFLKAAEKEKHLFQMSKQLILFSIFLLFSFFICIWCFDTEPVLRERHNYQSAIRLLSINQGC